MKDGHELSLDESLDVVAERCHRRARRDRDLGGRDRSEVAHVREKRKQVGRDSDPLHLELDDPADVLGRGRGLEEEVPVRHFTR